MRRARAGDLAARAGDLDGSGDFLAAGDFARAGDFLAAGDLDRAGDFLAAGDFARAGDFLAAGAGEVAVRLGVDLRVDWLRVVRALAATPWAPSQCPKSPPMRPAPRIVPTACQRTTAHREL